MTASTSLLTVRLAGWARECPDAYDFSKHGKPHGLGMIVLAVHFQGRSVPPLSRISGNPSPLIFPLPLRCLDVHKPPALLKDQGDPKLVLPVSEALGLSGPSPLALAIDSKETACSKKSCLQQRGHVNCLVFYRKLRTSQAETASYKRGMSRAPASLNQAASLPSPKALPRVATALL